MVHAEYIPLSLQIAFQAYLASALFVTASSRTFESGYDSFIRGIYDKLHNTGEELSALMLLPSRLTGRT